MDKKPNVFPNGKTLQEAMAEANEMGNKIAEQANKELDINSINIHKSKGELEAEAQMKMNTLNNLSEDIKKMDELLAKRKSEKPEKPKETIKTEVIYEDKPKLEANPVEYMPDVTTKVVETPIKEIIPEIIPKEVPSYPQDTSEHVPFDIIELPSEGLLYKNKKSGLKLAYLNAMDESIMTNPNLLQSGEFLEVLINRKMLDTDLTFRDLHIGDRNAIMIWLRSTGYGSIYNIVLSNPNVKEYEEFNVDVDLSKLDVIKLSVKPDENGHFNRELPVSKTNIKFKLLTVGNLLDIEDYIEEMDERLGYNDGSLFTLKQHVLEVDGNSDKEVIKKFVETMRIGDVLDLRKYINSIESGINMNLTVRTPGGESVKTFLPLNLSFFWPDIKL